MLLPFYSMLCYSFNYDNDVAELLCEAIGFVSAFPSLTLS